MTGISQPGPHRGLQPDSVTVRPVGRAGTHRRRVRSCRVARGRLRAPRPLTVWACADDHHPTGTGLLAGWLHTAVVKIVTSYTRPGDRVLLLTPPATPAESTAGRPGTALSTAVSTTTVPTAAGAWSRPGPLSGLRDAGWTVVRLGRDVVTRTVTTQAVPPSPATAPMPDSTAESQSGPGRAHGPAARAQEGPESDLHAIGHPATSPRADTPGLTQDRFDAIIATVDPSRTDWLDTLDWPVLLTPRGTLAMITHSEIQSGQLIDPTGSVVTALRGRRMAYHDHVVLLGTLLSGIAARPAGRGADSPPTPDAVAGWGRDAAVSSAQAHADVLIFTHSGASATSSASSTPGREASDV